MYVTRRLVPALLCLLLVSLAACSPSGELSGSADPGDSALDVEAGAQERTARGYEGPVAALEGFEGELDPWGDRGGQRVEPNPGYSMVGVAKPPAVLVFDEGLAADVAAMLLEFSASGTGNIENGQSGTAIHIAERVFASAGGLGTTRFRLVGSATRVIPQR